MQVLHAKVEKKINENSNWTRAAATKCQMDFEVMTTSCLRILKTRTTITHPVFVSVYMKNQQIQWAAIACVLVLSYVLESSFECYGIRCNLFDCSKSNHNWFVRLCFFCVLLFVDSTDNLHPNKTLNDTAIFTKVHRFIYTGIEIFAFSRNHCGIIPIVRI